MSEPVHQLPKHDMPLPAGCPDVSERRDFIRFAASALPLVTFFAAAPLQAQPQDAPKLLVVGDSMSAEYGLQRGEGWVQLLDQRLQSHASPQLRRWSVVNASVSGETTAGGRSRLAALLRQHQPKWVILELGGNDALRGLPLSSTRANVLAIVQACKAAGAGVLLVGMQVPPNYGKNYMQEFAALFQQIARDENIPLVPFLLSAFAERPDSMDWFQPDRIHPNAKAQPLMLDTVWKVLEKPMLQFKF